MLLLVSMELTILSLSQSLHHFSEYLQHVGNELFNEAFRIHQIRNLSVQQLRYLEVIEGHEGITPTQLAEIFNVRKPTVSNIIGQLENRSLIRRQTGTRDRRVSKLYPTELTSKIFQQRRGMYIKLAQHIQSKLSPNEIEHMVKLLEKAVVEMEITHE